MDRIAIKKFFDDIKEISKKNEMNYTESIIHFCEEKDMGIEEIVPYIKKNQKLKYELYSEARKLNRVKKSGRLPV